ncbi:hypothetical protein BKA24_000716 [Microbacterium marinum]|uniref:Flagellar protein FlgN n=1 Tax=Microbacterium marinum TaxID=421115 RepID=A0A7W7FHF9_9MICO|nr:hypothetical protein [Microbacterium marinum]MBB4666007.1 hypothetical protein [Microbacterium marinum]
MGDGVEIPLDSMQALSDALHVIIGEFEAAGGRTTELIEAIGEPQGDSRLARAAEDFESEWDDKRETQRRNLEEMKKRLDDARDGWRDADLELAASLEASE